MSDRSEPKAYSELKAYIFYRRDSAIWSRSDQLSEAEKVVRKALSVSRDSPVADVAKITGSNPVYLMSLEEIEGLPDLPEGFASLKSAYELTSGLSFMLVLLFLPAWVFLGGGFVPFDAGTKFGLQITYALATVVLVLLALYLGSKVSPAAKVQFKGNSLDTRLKVEPLGHYERVELHDDLEPIEALAPLGEIRCQRCDGTGKWKEKRRGTEDNPDTPGYRTPVEYEIEHVCRICGGKGDLDTSTYVVEYNKEAEQYNARRLLLVKRISDKRAEIDRAIDEMNRAVDEANRQVDDINTRVEAWKTKFKAAIPS